jgi:uncharacterized membrane protein
MQFLFHLNIHGYPVLVIPWNIFLAIVPCLIAHHLSKSVGHKKWTDLKGHKSAFILIFLFWLFMLPNTAYLIFDVRHLIDYCDNLNIYRVCQNGSWLVIFFFTYAVIGVPTLYYAINKMSRVFATVFGKPAATLLPVFAIPLTSIGLMFGLYSRFNSWDVLFRPVDLMKTVAFYFTDARMIVDFLVFTVCLYFIFYLTKYLLKG